MTKYSLILIALFIFALVVGTTNMQIAKTYQAENTPLYVGSNQIPSEALKLFQLPAIAVLTVSSAAPDSIEEKTKDKQSKKSGEIRKSMQRVKLLDMVGDVL